MSLETVYNTLNRIAETSSSNEKIAILKIELEDPLFRKVVKYALSKDMTFKVKQFPPFKERKGNLMLPNIDRLLDYLKKLSGKPGVTKAEKEHLFSLLVERPTYEVVKKICTKDLRIGADAKLINKARKGTVNRVPYMRCMTTAKINNIKFEPEAIVQEKADGTYVDLMINGIGQIKIITRNGKIVYGLHSLKHDILQGKKKQTYGSKHISKKSGILKSPFTDLYLGQCHQGELVVVKGGVVLDRKTGNGIINQCISGTASKEDRDCVVFRMWDTMPLDNFYHGYYDVHYNSRLFDAQSFVKSVNSDRVQMVETVRVKNVKEAWVFYEKMRKEGKEGAVLKNTFSEWRDHTSPNQIKMKNTSDFEGHIVGWYHGREGTNFEKCIGGLIYESSCGKLKGKVGSGLTFADRGFKIVKKKHKNAIPTGNGFGGVIYIDKIVARKAMSKLNKEIEEGFIGHIEFESIIKDKRNKKAHTLFLPRYVEKRIDKDEADSLADLQNR